jgi:hypothetical protein
MFQFKQSETTATRRRIFFYASAAADGYTPVTTGLSTSTVVEVTKNGVTPATLVLSPSFTHISNGLWYHELAQSLLDTVGIVTVTITDAVMRPVQAVGYVYSGDPLTVTTAPTAADIWSYTTRTLTSSLDPTATQIWAAATRTLTGAVTVSGNVTVGGFTAGSITSAAFGNSAINLRLANDPIASSARFTTYDSFSGYPLLSQTAQHQISITGSHHAAADVHEFQPNVLTSGATDTSFVDELVDAVWNEILSTHNTAGSAGKILQDVNNGSFSLTGTVSTVTNSQVFTTSLIGYVDGAFDHQTLVFVDGVLAGESKPILEFTGATGSINMEEAFTQAPSPGDTFAVLPQHVHAIQSIADGLLNRLLDSSGDSVDQTNERTVRSALRAMRNKVVVNAGSITVYKEDDASEAWTGTVDNITDVEVNPTGGS